MSGLDDNYGKTTTITLQTICIIFDQLNHPQHDSSIGWMSLFLPKKAQFQRRCRSNTSLILVLRVGLFLATSNSFKWFGSYFNSLELEHRTKTFSWHRDHLQLQIKVSTKCRTEDKIFSSATLDWYHGCLLSRVYLHRPIVNFGRWKKMWNSKLAHGEKRLSHSDLRVFEIISQCTHRFFPIWK